MGRTNCSASARWQPSAGCLVSALRDVRYAVSHDPEDPRLTGALEVRVSGGTITLTRDGVTVEAPVPEVDFPAHRMLLEQRRREVLVDADSLRRDLEASGTAPLPEDALVVTDDDVSVLSIGDDAVRLGTTDEPTALVVAVNRRFLLEALQVGDQLTLGLDDPIAPLAIRHPDRVETLSVLMPVRLDQPA